MAEFTRQIEDPTFHPTPVATNTSSSSRYDGMANAVGAVANSIAEYAGQKRAEKDEEKLGEAYLSFFDALTGGQEALDAQVIAGATKEATSINNAARQTGDYSTGRTQALASFRKWAGANPMHARQLSEVFGLATGASPGDLYKELQSDLQADRQRKEELWSNTPGDNPNWSDAERAAHFSSYSSSIANFEAAASNWTVARSNPKISKEKKDAIFNDFLKTAQPLALVDIVEGIQTGMEGYSRNEPAEIRIARTQHLEDLKLAFATRFTNLSKDSGITADRRDSITAAMNGWIDNAIATVNGEKDKAWLDNMNTAAISLSTNKKLHDIEGLLEMRGTIEAIGADVYNNLDPLDKRELDQLLIGMLAPMKALIKGSTPDRNPVTGLIEDNEENAALANGAVSTAIDMIGKKMKDPENANWEELSPMLHILESGINVNYDKLSKQTTRKLIGTYANPNYIKAPAQVYDNEAMVSIFNSYTKDVTKSFVSKYQKKIGALGLLGRPLSDYVGLRPNKSGQGIEAFVKDEFLPAPQKGTGEQARQAADSRNNLGNALVSMANEMNNKYVSEFNTLVRAYAHRVQGNQDYKTAVNSLLASGSLHGNQAVQVQEEFIRNELASDPDIAAKLKSGELTNEDFDAYIAEVLNAK